MRWFLGRSWSLNIFHCSRSQIWYTRLRSINFRSLDRSKLNNQTKAKTFPSGGKKKSPDDDEGLCRIKLSKSIWLILIWKKLRRESINDPNKFYRKQFVTLFELNQLRNLYFLILLVPVSLSSLIWGFDAVFESSWIIGSIILRN